jgi:hypothetical protein
VHDTWAARDLPVLDATVGLLEQSYMVTVTDIAARTGLEPPVVAKALEALDPVYVDFRKTTTGGDPRFWYVFKVTPEARRAVGQWPTPESLANRLADELAAAAQRESDSERQSLLIYAARLIGDTLQEYTVRAAAGVLAPALGSVQLPELDELPLPGPMPEPDAQPAPAVLPELAALPEQDHGAEFAGGPEPGLPESDRHAEAGGGPDAGLPESDRHLQAPGGPDAGLPETDRRPEAADGRKAEPGTAAAELAPLPEAAAFPASSVTTARSAWPSWPAVDSPAAPVVGQNDPDADTDMDLVQARPEAV